MKEVKQVASWSHSQSDGVYFTALFYQAAPLCCEKKALAGVCFEDSLCSEFYSFTPLFTFACVATAGKDKECLMKNSTIRCLDNGA